MMSPDQIAALVAKGSKVGSTSTIVKKPVLERTDGAPPPTISVAPTDRPGPEYEEIRSLPSRFLFYPFKSLFVRRFTVAELLLIYQGEQSGSNRPTVRTAKNRTPSRSSSKVTLRGVPGKSS